MLPIIPLELHLAAAGKRCLLLLAACLSSPLKLHPEAAGSGTCVHTPHLSHCCLSLSLSSTREQDLQMHCSSCTVFLK